ncbi:MAG: hypothetical protein HYV09_31150 [Deltaproteobacteria bacterium]|nr:hypothetical protein [Deltaproteobacteria bacterium]
MKKLSAVLACSVLSLTACGALGPGDGSEGAAGQSAAAQTESFATVRGFKVEIDGAAGKEVDTAWESVSGGELIIEVTETTIGSDRDASVSPARSSGVGNVTLRGVMTRKRAALCTWTANRALDSRQTLTVTEQLSVDGQVSDGKQIVLSDCFPIRCAGQKLQILCPRERARVTLGPVACCE